MRYASSIPTKDARALFRIRRSIRPVVHCHVPVQ
jgi:hypothetical protein